MAQSSKSLGKRRATFADPLLNPSRAPASRSSLVASQFSSGWSYNTPLKAHHACVNAIAFSRGGGEWLASGGDDKRVLLWNSFGDMTTEVPRATYKGARSNIFTIAFTSCGRKLLSGGNDDMILLFDLETNAASATGPSRAASTPVDLFRHDAPVKSVCTHPTNPALFMSASDDGSIRTFDLRTDGGVVNYINEAAEFNDVAYSPVVDNLFVTTDSAGRVLLQDARVAFGDGDHLASEACVRQYATSLRLRTDEPPSYSSKRYNFDSSSIVFDPSGRLICSTISRYLPTLFDISDEQPLATFGAAGYANACTIKHGDFGGTPENLYYAAGSDDFNAYVWSVPPIDVLKARRQDLLVDTKILPDTPRVCFDYATSNTEFEDDVAEDEQRSSPTVPSHISIPSSILTGHRSVVNTVLFHPSLPFLVTSGVEKVVLVHSPTPFANSSIQPPFVPRDRNPHRPPPVDLRGSEEEDLGVLEYFDLLLETDRERWGGFVDGKAPAEDSESDSEDDSDDSLGIADLDSDDFDEVDQDENDPRRAGTLATDAGDGDRTGSEEEEDGESGSGGEQDSDSGVDDADLIALGAGPEDLG